MNSLKLAVFTPVYPSPERPKGNIFVKSRVDEYAKKGYHITAFGYGPQNRSFQMDGIQVYEGSWDYVSTQLDQYPFDRFLVHLIDRRVALYILKNRCFHKCILWIHGFEALGWYRDVLHWKFSFSFFKQRLIRAFRNMLELATFRYLIFRSQGQIKYIFVSKWMRQMAQIDLLYPFSDYKIIPNPIDTRFFDYQIKPAEQRLKILFIRAYNHPKYAADLALQSILEFSKHPFFSKFEFFIAGGECHQLVSSLESFPNVTIRNGFLNHDEMKALCHQYGVYLCPSRQDAQGVSMCEAMSCGMLVIGSQTTAIPEFVKHMETGILTRSVQDIVQAYIQLYEKPDQFQKFSESAAKWIRENIDMPKLIQQELDEIIK